MQSTRMKGLSIIVPTMFLCCIAYTLNEQLVALATIRDTESDIEMLRLIGLGANAMLTLDKNGESLLHLACIYDTPGKVKLLLDNGADPNYRATKSVNLLEMTPLSWCVYGGYTASVQEILHDPRTNVNIVFYTEDGSYVTAMDIAYKIGEERGGDIVKLLQAAGGKTYKELEAEYSRSNNGRGEVPFMPSLENSPVVHDVDLEEAQDDDEGEVFRTDL